MSFRRKLIAVFALTVIVSVAAVAWLVEVVTRRVFETTENERTAALVRQFQHEFSRRGDDLARRLEGIANSEPLVHLATALGGPPAQPAESFDLARSIAESQQLEFLEFLDQRGIIISSAQSPAKFGYPDPDFDALAGANEQGAFLKREDTLESAALGLFAVRAVRVGDHPVYVVGGQRLDKNFLSALDLPPDMRALLYQNGSEYFSPELLLDPLNRPGLSRPADRFAPLVNAVRRSDEETTVLVSWSRDPADDEIFHAIPLHGLGKDPSLLAILLIGNSRRLYVELRQHIRDAALLAGGGGIVLAILLSSWAAIRVTRPVQQLALAAQNVAAGDWHAHVEVSGHDEFARLAESFNRMTTELLAQKERLVQTERVAAWRELARRLAHELKNPLFPLQLTVENLIRARTQSPDQFEEVFQESSNTLLAEISNLKGIIGRFSDFSKMPQPQLHRVEVNEIVSSVAQLFQAQFRTSAASIACKLDLDPSLGEIAADPELLHRAISNLVLNAMDAMPKGGTLTLRTRGESNAVRIEVSDTGVGLTPEECERIFTPYYTSKQHGTGLGLAIAQSVISDHGGSISVVSRPGEGTKFTMLLPGNRVVLPNLESHAGKGQDQPDPRRNVAAESESADRR